MEKILIRDVLVTDAVEVNELMFQSSVGMYQLQGYELYEVEHKFKNRNTAEGIKKTENIIESLSANEKYIVAVAENKIIGLSYAEKEAGQNILRALYVLPDFQQKGVGKLLWQNISEWLGKGRVYLNVLDSNSKALKFYESLGFVPTGNVSTKPGLTPDSELKEVEMVRV